ncbi:potassium channel family protein [Nonomuraea sp. SBT364]|uniref:potassium channel family protein n=1 Tax=Nonomuraea sp. SBT364 TaxID=1580530 RepID=UPI00069EFC4C|nr:ion channel [Nonomuraea sp. SBT364]
MWRLIWNTGLVIALYYLVPLEAGVPVWLRWARAAVFAAGVALVVWSVARAIRRQATAEPGTLPATGLASVTVVGVVLFALADYGVAVWGEGEFAGLRTRTDALYFAVSTLATVGFGDVHAQGQVARTLVLAQMVFNLVVLATAAGLLTRRVRERTAGRGGAGR